MPENRTKTGRFVAGTSGNPGGRPRQTQEQRDALETIYRLSSAAAALLEDYLTNPQMNPTVRLKAAEIVLNKVYGKVNIEDEMKLRSMLSR